MNFYISTRWSVRLAIIIIVLLVITALTSNWWLPYDQQAIELTHRLLHQISNTGLAPTI